MRAEFLPGTARGQVSAPPSKSMAHRLLICAGLSGGPCVLEGVAYSQDILATLDCLSALGVRAEQENGRLNLSGGDPFFSPKELVCCRESGSTLRFFAPIFLLGKERVALTGKGRLMARPMEIYARICQERTLLFRQEEDCLYLRGPLSPGLFTLPGDVSSQFISGLLFALPLLEAGSVISLIPPVSSRPYIEMTRQAQAQFGVESYWTDQNTLRIPGGQRYRPVNAQVEGDWSNAAFLEGFNLLGGQTFVTGLNPNSLQGDKIYQSYYEVLAQGCPALDIDQCPDLGPVLMALAAANHGAVLTGTARLRLKESDRGAAMAAELAKLRVQCSVEQEVIRVPGGCLHPPKEPLWGHNDHRVVMALSLLLSRTGGSLLGVEAADKSFPDFFEKLGQLGLEVVLYED